METFLLALIWFYPAEHFPPFYKAEPLRFETRAACEAALEKMNTRVPPPRGPLATHATKDPQVQYVGCLERWALPIDG